MRTLIAWNYELLETPERAVLERLAALPGEFGLLDAERECAKTKLEEVTALDVLDGLVDACFVDQSEPGRYRLPTTVRHYLHELRGAGC